MGRSPIPQHLERNTMNKTIGKFFRLSNDENQKLKELSIKSKLSETEVIRALLENAVIKEAPPKEFYRELQRLNSLYSSVMYINRLADTTGTIYETELNICLKSIKHFIDLIKEKYL